MERKKREQLRNYIWIALLVLVGAICGFSVPYVFDLSVLAALEPVERFLAYAILVLLVWIAYMVQVVLHEAGHLVGGLLSGYRFSSFRIGRWMIVKINGSLKWKRLFLAGTGGQCLMIPSERSGIVLFFLGGALFNLFGGAIFLLFWVLTDLGLLAEVFFAASSVFAGLLAILNGLPFQTGLIANDGSNIVSLKKDPAAAEQFANHLRMNAMSVDGVRLREMPEEWFVLPSGDQLGNHAFAETAVFFCNRLLDEHRFSEAQERIQVLLETDSAIAGVHRKLLICDLIYCEAVGARRREVFVRWMDRDQLNFIRSMKEYPSVIRTEYAYTRLLQCEPIQANRIKARFEKSAATYPNWGEILSERELIRYADSIEVEENLEQE